MSNPTGSEKTSTSSSNSPKYIRRKQVTVRLLLIALVMLSGMTAYEALKQFLFPEITIWQSHVITIFFSTFISLILSYFIMRKTDLLLERSMNDNIILRKTEENLRLSEEKFYQLFNANPDWVIISTPNEGRYIDVNDAFIRMTGYRREEVIGHTSLELGIWVNPEIREIMIHVLLKDGMISNHEVRFRMKSGKIRFMLRSAVLIKLEDEPAILSVCKDITNRKQIETEKKELANNLRKSIKELNCLYSISSILEIPDISMENKIKKIVNVLPFAWQHPDISCAKITINNDEYMTDNCRDTIWKQMSDIRVHGSKIGNIEVCYLEQRPEIDEGPFLQQERNMINSISESLSRFIERVKIEEALRDTEQRLQMIMDSMPAGLIAVDMETRCFIFVNKTICQMLGYRQEELLRLSFSDIHPAEDLPQVISEFEKALNSNSIHAKNFPVQRRDGSLFPAEIHRLFMELGGRRCVLGIFIDISERKQLEEIILLRLSLWDYSTAHSMNEVIQKALDEIGRITGSPIGFYHFVEKDQKTLALQTWSTRTLKEFCKTEGAGMHYSIDVAGVWVDCVHQRKPVIHNNYKALAHRRGMPTGHAEVVRELVVPTLREGRIVSILGVGNKPTDYDEKDVMLVSYIADSIWEIVDRKRTDEALIESEKKFRELSIIDNLTQLYNSRHFYDKLKMEIDHVNRYKVPMTLILLDVDNFKVFNDTYGHIEGDQVLVRLGQVIKKCLRKTDSAYRYGGEEFIILLTATKKEDGVTTAERIRTEFKKEKFSPVQEKDIQMTLSIGVSQYIPEEEMKIFVHRVDQLMYQAKKNGKDRVCY